ncbi:uncharacterized protein LOC124948108 isoform X2 [Vespa velutina]|uniref:uncharacterized protein LOC124948108 isoform X2 n=1 Tax=Vespa velutina TaxID=202808 RepID=UPI001FB3C7E8|nr:uncharacterized protein LOC124948108 isoform X2 [Vespa velutina]
MKTDINDPWSRTDTEILEDTGGDNRFEDSFVEKSVYEHEKLSDSEQYLQKLYSRLKALQKNTTKKDLVSSLSVAKEECIARLITSEYTFKSEEEAVLGSNPLIRHIVPHLQALTASELIHLLKADVLQVVTEAIEEQELNNKNK